MKYRNVPQLSLTIHMYTCQRNYCSAHIILDVLYPPQDDLPPLPPPPVRAPKLGDIK